MVLRILHVADLHTTPSHRPLTAVNDHLRRLPGGVRAVVVTGDLIHRGNATCYRQLGDDLAELARSAPLVTVLGNHDDPEAAGVCRA